jgi:hypothetical protein
MTGGELDFAVGEGAPKQVGAVVTVELAGSDGRQDPRADDRLVCVGVLGRCPAPPDTDDHPRTLLVLVKEREAPAT